MYEQPGIFSKIPLEYVLVLEFVLEFELVEIEFFGGSERNLRKNLTGAGQVFGGGSGFLTTSGAKFTH